MTNKFAQALKVEDSNESRSITENGALGLAKTKSRLVDFFFKVGSMRNMSPADIATQFAEAYAENSARALELLFMVRDCRGGMGEKRTFNVCFDWLVRNFPGDANDLVRLIPEYGSWKTFFELTDALQQNSNVWDSAKAFVVEQLTKDTLNAKAGKSVSLLGKWMPSENTSSKATRSLATLWRNALHLDSKTYRQSLSVLRKAIKIVEADMSAGNWDQIDYNAVPSKAGMLYRNAFMKHDEERRKIWLADLASGKEGVKINTAALTVADMVHVYSERASASGWSHSGWNQVEEDPTIEAAWRDLVAKNMMAEDEVALLPVVDGSGSMYAPISNSSKVQAIDVSMALGLFLANINTPAWRGMIMEYGSNPAFFAVPTGASLLEQLKIAVKHDDCGSTNVEAVYDLILNTAVKNHFKQEDIPNVVCFSDMEFDMAMGSWYNRSITTATLFQSIIAKWTAAGYKLPKQIFWNINSRTGTIPLTENEFGVALLSGYSQSIIGMILSRKLDPLAILLEKLDSPRYDLVRKALAAA